MDKLTPQEIQANSIEQAECHAAEARKNSLELIANIKDEYFDSFNLEPFRPLHIELDKIKAERFRTNEVVPLMADLKTKGFLK